MFCGFKIEITDQQLYDKLHSNPVLKWKFEHDDEGIVSPWSYASFKNINFKTYLNGWIEISGSLHKFWNNGEHNYNDFNLINVKEAIDELYSVFGINPNSARLSNLEYGFNIPVPFNPDRFIKSLICYRFNNFNLWNDRFFFGKVSEMGQYFIKIYNKSKPYNLPNNILRIEKSIKKMEVLSKEPLFLIDLLNPKIQAKCLKQVQEAFNHILFNEIFDRTKLTKPQVKIYQSVAIEIDRWGLKDEDGNKRFNAKQRCILKSGYLKIIKTHGKEKFRPIINNLINENYNLLIKKGNVLTGYINDKKMECSDTFNTPSNHTLSINQSTRVCYTCGRDISAQKNNSKYCSELHFGKEAKKCRNDISNPKNNEKNKLNLLKSRGLLFPIEPFFKVKREFTYTLRAGSMQ
jgi:hypothetical protein